jgi:radical SAM protein (TIGR01212 family)
LLKSTFRGNAKRYCDLKSFWINQFGCKVYKLPIDAGFTCPNRDGTISSGGCIYCDGRGSRLRQAGPLPSISEQIHRGKEYYKKYRDAGKYIAYFQTFTNTYGHVEKLKELYDKAVAEEDIVGLSVGTRPDCVPDDVLDLFQNYAKSSHIWLELGLQSIHNRTLQFINRGHSAETFIDTVKRASGKNIHICTHMIVGLPGETQDDILETAMTLSTLPIQGIKIHLLLALRGTVMGDLYEERNINMLDKDEYIRTVCNILEILPPEMVIQRLTADGYRDIFLAPHWAVNKMDVLNAIDRELEKRNTYQGIHYNKI